MTVLNYLNYVILIIDNNNTELPCLVANKNRLEKFNFSELNSEKTKNIENLAVDLILIIIL